MAGLPKGSTFPHLEIPKVGGGTLSLPADLAGDWGVVLVYRGSWCPYCQAQLAQFERATTGLAEVGVRTVAFSVDGEGDAAGTVEKYGLSFPVGYGADAREVGALLDATVNDDPAYLQATGFVLRPDGTIAVAVYSNDAIGRLTAADVVGFVRYQRQQG